MKRPVIVTSKATDDYSVTSSSANIPGLECIAPEDGYYDISTSFTINPGTSTTVYFPNIGINNDNLYGGQGYSQGTADDSRGCITLHPPVILLKKGDSVTSRIYAASATGTVQYVAGNREPILTIRKVN